jgi:hypothetical protein
MALVKLNNRGVRSATTFGSISALGEMRFISKQTASSSATISFTSGIDSTYKEYLFTFNNIHPATDNTNFSFQVDTGTNTSYNITCTSTWFMASHGEGDAGGGLGYEGSQDQAQGTAFQNIIADHGNANDKACSGYLQLFNPSSSVFIKHFMAVGSGLTHETGHVTNHYNPFVAGYFNTTTALTRVQFKFSTGNIDAGDICLYGIN